MKKTLLFLILVPFFTFGQNYSNFTQSIVLSDLTTTTSGGGGGSIAITDNTLTVNFSGGWSTYPMRTGVIKYLNISPAISYLELGAIMNSARTAQTGYFAKIENNNLTFYTTGSPALLTGCSLSFTKTFPKNTTQNKINFEYDTEGNQTKRTFKIISTSKKEQTQKEEVTSQIIKEDNISYYPNPVNQELNLSWELADNKTVTDIQVYALNGQLLKTYKNSKNKNIQTIPFHDYPTGAYLIVLIYDNADQKTIKIIKK